MQELQLTRSDNRSEATAQVGDTVVITLPENATTGYQWEVESFAGDRLSLDGNDRAGVAAESLGAGGGEAIFRFRTTSSGDAAIALKLWRGFEPDTSGLYTFTITIHIAS